jgi:hypothetical protein
MLVTFEERLEQLIADETKKHPKFSTVAIRNLAKTRLQLECIDTFDDVDMARLDRIAEQKDRLLARRTSIPVELRTQEHEERISAHEKKANIFDPQLSDKTPTVRTAKQIVVTDPTSIDHRDPNNFLNTKLHVAVMSRDAKTIRLLLLQGANPHIRNISGKTPAQVAVDYDFDDLADLLDPIAINAA